MILGRLFVIGGPTAAGKSSAAVHLAKRLDGVVISADAMQVYRRMDVGTGKVTNAEMCGVPHFGLDLREPNEPFDVGDFIALADEVISTYDNVVVVGGTSLYLHGLIRGIVETPPVDPGVRAELEQREDIYSELQAVDSALALRLHPNDRMRIIRGLEVFRLTGERLSDMHAKHAMQPDRYAVTSFWLDRSDLDARIDARVLDMVENGYVRETERLLHDGFSPDLKPMQSLGYRHFCRHVTGEISLTEAIELTQRDTRRFARKQRTWQNRLNFTILMDDHSGLIEQALRQ